MTSSINVKIFQEDNPIKTFNEGINLDKQNWPEYLRSLKTVQTNVNTFLSQLVEQENDEENKKSDEEDCDDSDDEDGSRSPKRKLESTSDKLKKKRKK